MTMTFEPFTPAGAPEQQRYDGRRRAEDRSAADGPWSEPPVTADWDAPPRPQRWDPEPRRPEPPRTEGWDTGRRRVVMDEPGGDRAPAVEPRWDATPQPWDTGQPPAAPWVSEAQWVSEAEPEPAGRERGGRAKPLILGAVVLLLLVAGWQAYRIEGMSRHNAALASGLSAEKDRTDRLEKQLAGVFDPEGVSSSVLPSVFRVRAGDFTGTAFSVGDKAKGGESNLFTNYHVVAGVWSAGGRKVTLERGNTRINATIEKVSKGKDLALLRAEQEIAGLGAAKAQVKPGQQVVVVGAPLGLDDTVTTGVISAWRPDDPDGPTIQFDAPINPGNSGGPVVNANEQVVGVATAKAKDAEGIGLAIPIKTACETFSVC